MEVWFVEIWVLTRYDHDQVLNQYGVSSDIGSSLISHVYYMYFKWMYYSMYFNKGI